MQLITACKTILGQLSAAVSQLDEKDFVRPSVALSGMSIGKHMRHTLEFFTCLENGFFKGVINYDERDHDVRIENDKTLSLALLERITDFISSTNENKEFVLKVSYSTDEESPILIQTNYFRELTYNIEHVIHHMAIMKIGFREIASYVHLSEDFGVAASTIRYRESGINAAG